MKDIQIGIKSIDEGFKDLNRVFEAARTGKRFKPIEGTYFTSLEAARNFLTPKRIQLLTLIRERKPKSIYALAKLCNRGFATVFRDVSILERHGLLKLSRATSSRRSVRPIVSYGAIHLRIPI